MHHLKNVTYNALIKTRAESILKQHAIKRTDLDVLFLGDNKNNDVKQHQFSSSSSMHLRKKLLGIMFN